MKHKKLSVLLAENNEMDAKVLRMQLKQWYDLRLFDVVDNEPAYRRALENKNRYDIIISDYRIPGFSGLLALDIRNELCRDKPFIIYTSSKNEVSAIETIHRGADNYVLKSHSKNLFNVINKAISDKKNEKVNEIILEASVVALKLGYDSTLFDLLYTKLNELVYARNMYIALYDKHYGGYRFLFYCDELDDKRRFTGKDSEKSLTEYVRRTGRVLYATREKQDELIAAGEVEQVGTPASEWLGIPLKVGDEVIAVLALQNHGNEKVYAEEDIEYLEKLAPTLALIIARNVSDKEVQKRTRALENSPVITIIIDADGFIEYINPTFEKVTGFSTAPLIGKKFSVLDAGGEASFFYKRLETALKNKTAFNGEVFAQRKNGEYFWSAVYMSPVKNKAGEVESFIVISEDITKDKLKSKELLEMLKRARESDRLKSSFLANLSHEVRTPLNHILGFSELLLGEHLSDEEKKEYKNIIHTAGQRLLLFITNAVELSKIESDTFEINPKTFNIYTLMSKLHAEYKAYIRQMADKDVTFAFVYPKKAPKVVHSDQRAVEIIVSNLIDNAVKFTPEGSISLNVEYKKDEKERGWFEISVADTGIGIEEDKMDLIFKPFRQIDDSLTRTFEGAGLGLPVSKEIAGLIGGEIMVKSERNKGSVFTLKIPDKTEKQLSAQYKKDEEESEILQTLGNLLSDRLSGKTFFYLGNKNKTYYKLAGWCKQLNTGLTVVENAENLIQRLGQTKHPGVVFLYIELNPVQHVGTIKAVKNAYPGVKVVAIMKHSLSVDKNVVLTAGADGVLTRPLDVREYKMLFFDYFLYRND